MKTLLFTSLAALGLFDAQLSAQPITTWSSSAPDVVSVNATTGKIKLIKDVQQDVIISATTTYNGKTVVSKKTVKADGCTSCFVFNGLTYCGIRLSNGQCWLDRNIGASRVATSPGDSYAFGCYYSCPVPSSVCPSGWRVPSNSDYQSLINLIGNSISSASNGALKFPFSGYIRTSSCSCQSQCGENFYLYTSNNYTFASYDPSCSCNRSVIRYSAENDCGVGYYTIRCIKN